MLVYLVEQLVNPFKHRENLEALHLRRFDQHNPGMIRCSGIQKFQERREFPLNL